ncbi:hypothetical protein FBZ91_13926 [Nitrospirillum viridazoti]|nr:hypothetical protein [Nitrospirillum amazonense]TWB26618.1 hypothetical protein FBZ91_13926 [Nitrospirillum amazonense]
MRVDRNDGEYMLKGRTLAAALTLACATVNIAHADVFTVRGKIMFTQGHMYPACRIVQLKRLSDGGTLNFRIPDTGKDDGILATTLTALTTGLQVEITYDTNQTTGCGSEPQIQYITIFPAS